MTEISVSEISTGRRFRNELGDIDSLADSIKHVGLLQPLVVSRKHELVAGFRRLQAVKRLGWTKVPVIVGGEPDGAD